MAIVSNRDSTGSGSLLATSLASLTPTEQAERRPEEWPGIIEAVRYWIRKEDVDDGLPHFDRLFAKIATRELRTPSSPHPQGVALCGATGNGKTFRLRFMQRHLKGMHMETAVEMVERIEANDSLEFFREITRTDVGGLDVTPPRYYDLIIDDIGFEKAQSVNFGNRRDIMERILLARYMVYPQHLTHFSTNLTEEQLRERYGDRIFSRLKEMCLFVTMKGEDRRTAK